MRRKGTGRVSVIIPTFNRPKLLKVAIESVLTQTYPNIEVIVVDDGSTDNTPAMMAQYASQVTYIRQANQGVTAARNRGIQAASGDYFNFLDHDDFFLPTKIERQVQLLESQPEYGLVHCGYYHADINGNYLDKIIFLPQGNVLKELVQGCFIVAHAPLIRRQCLETVGMFDNSLPGRGQYAEDWDLWLRMALAGYQFALIPEPLCAYRMLPDSIMSNPAKLEDPTIAVLDRIFVTPGLPAEVAAVKKQTYMAKRSWLSWRYYAAGHWEDARRNLIEAINLNSQLLGSPVELLESLYHHALSAHVANPLQLVNDVFDHLPASAESLQPYRSHILGRVYTGLALRNYSCGNIAQAKLHLTEAIAADPGLPQQLQDFAEALSHHAVSLPLDSPLMYIDTVLNNLPTGAQRFKQVRSRVLSDITIASAFQDYFAGRRRRVVQQVLAALLNRPSLLVKNRGVVSIFLKSMLGLKAREQRFIRM